MTKILSRLKFLMKNKTSKQDPKEQIEEIEYEHDRTPNLIDHAMYNEKRLFLYGERHNE